MSRVRTAAAVITAVILLMFGASVAPGLDWSDQHGIGVAWTQLSGILSVLLMSVVVVLSARPRLLERPLGGLDKMYRLHKWLGLGAILFGILHWLTATGDGHRPTAADAAQPVADAAATVAATAAATPAATPAATDAAPAFLQSLMGPAHQLAQPALFAMIALGLIALIRLVPYRWFAKTHIVMVPLFLFFIFHAVVLMKASYWSLPISWFTLAVMAPAGIAAIYALFHYAGLTPTVGANVVATTYFPEVQTQEIILQVDSAWPGHTSGQFAFVTTNRHEGAHPFTIASAWNPADGRIRFIAKELGDHTARLREEFTQGRSVRLEGPYGRFTFDDGSKRQIWIGAGIGITPFVARMHQRAATPDGKTVDLFHATAEVSPEALQRLRDDAAVSGTGLHILISPRDGRLDGAAIEAAIPDWREASFWFCGPALFGNALRRQFRALGLADADWHQELFEMR